MIESCERKSVHKLTDWNEIEGYKEEARVMVSAIEPRLLKGEKLSWDSLKETCRMNATLWKLLLKELRIRGYNIGNYKQQYVSKTNGQSY